MKYPEIKVYLTGRDAKTGEVSSLIVSAILNTVKAALEKNNVPQAEIEAFLTEAKSDAYGHVLQTCMEWVKVR